MINFLGYFFRIILGVIAFFAVFNTLERKPFKFEHFKNGENATAFFKARYPVGTDVNIILKEMKEAGVDFDPDPVKKLKKESSISEGGDDEYIYIYIGEYSTNFVSLDPLGSYHISIYTDLNKNLITILTFRWEKFT